MSPIPATSFSLRFHRLGAARLVKRLKIARSYSCKTHGSSCNWLSSTLKSSSRSSHRRQDRSARWRTSSISPWRFSAPKCGWGCELWSFWFRTVFSCSVSHVQARSRGIRSWEALTRQLDRMAQSSSRKLQYLSFVLGTIWGTLLWSRNSFCRLGRLRWEFWARSTLKVASNSLCFSQDTSLRTSQGFASNIQTLLRSPDPLETRHGLGFEKVHECFYESSACNGRTPCKALPTFVHSDPNRLWPHLSSSFCKMALRVFCVESRHHREFARHQFGFSLWHSFE